MLLAVITRIQFARATRGLDSRPNPTSTYEEALKRFEAFVGPEPESALLPECRSILLDHGTKRPRVAVLLHGLTNCPQQFRELATRLHADGWNVLVPLLPRHGRADRLSENLTPMKAEEMRELSDTAVDIATGLGEEVVVAGLSAGGVAAAWIAQNRPEVSRSVLIAPALGFIPTKGRRLNELFFFLLPLLPDIKTDRFAVDPNAPTHTYPGFSSRSLGQLLRLSGATLDAASKRPPAVQSVALLTSEQDTAVNRVMAWQLISLWRMKGVRILDTYDFPKSEGVQHDMIDPAQTYAKTPLVYPVVLGLMGASDPDLPASR